MFEQSSTDVTSLKILTASEAFFGLFFDQLFTAREILIRHIHAILTGPLWCMRRRDETAVRAFKMCVFTRESGKWFG